MNSEELQGEWLNLTLTEAVLHKSARHVAMPLALRHIETWGRDDDRTGLDYVVKRK